MGKCAKRAFENGGAISKADQLMAEMEKKYGVSGKSAPAPAPAPQPAQQPAPKTQGIVSGISGVFGGRQNQLDQQERKALGYSNGGKIQGPGTPTSDSIPAKVNETGEEIRVSNGERIVSAAQGALLEALARKSGFDSLDALLEAGTGKPVGPTIKGGKMAAEGGLYLDNNPDEYAKAMQGARNIMSIPSLVTNNQSAEGGIYKDVGIPALATNNSAAQGGIYKDVGLPSISIGAGQAPTIYDNGGLRTNTDRVSGSLPVANVSRINSPSENVTGNNRIGIFDKDPLAALSEAIGKNNAAVNAANAGVQKLYPEGTFVNPASASPPSGKTNPLSSLPAASYSNEGRGIASQITKQNPSSVVDNEFTKDGTNYTVNPTSQAGISSVTAPGKNPLITNIDPQKAVAGLNNQTIGQPADQEAQGIARIANANKIRGEMIASRDKDIPAGGFAPSILADRSAEDNAALDAMRRSSMISNLSPSQQAEFNMNLARMAQQERGQNLAADTARHTADAQEKRAAGHDQTLATIEANKLAGNPLEQQAKQLDLKQKGIIAGLLEKANAGDKDALAKYIALTNGGKEPNYSNRYITLPNRKTYNDMGQVTGEEPGGVFDAQTGQPVNFGKQPAASAPPGYKLVGTSGGRPVYEDAKGNRFVDGGK